MNYTGITGLARKLMSCYKLHRRLGYGENNYSDN